MRPYDPRNRHVVKLSHMLARTPEDLSAVLESALRATIEEASRDTSIHATSDDLWAVESRLVNHVAGLLGSEPYDEARDALLVTASFLLRDCGSATSPKARQAFVHEARDRTTALVDSLRWREVCYMLDEFRYFDNVTPIDALEQRWLGQWSSAGIRSHGISCGWNVGCLVHGQARMGFDTTWNKVHDAAVLLWWPGIDHLGKRTWHLASERIRDMLDPTSSTHRNIVRNDMVDMNLCLGEGMW